MVVILVWFFSDELRRRIDNNPIPKGNAFYKRYCRVKQATCEAIQDRISYAVGRAFLLSKPSKIHRNHHHQGNISNPPFKTTASSSVERSHSKPQAHKSPSKASNSIYPPSTTAISHVLTPTPPSHSLHHPSHLPSPQPL